MPRRAQTALTAALATLAALSLVYLAAVHLGPVRWLDASVLDGFASLDGPRVRPIASFIAHLCNPDHYVWFVAGLVTVALLRRRRRTALAVFAVLIGSGLTTHLLKPALATPRHSPLLENLGQINASSWPSGHATAAMAIALCAILVAPQRLRPWVAALGAVFAVAVTFSFLVLAWHFPSDVVGGFLVATTWTLFAVAGLAWAQERWPRSVSSSPSVPLRAALAPPVVTTVSAGLVALLVLLARPAQVVSYAQEHTAFVLGAGMIAAAALALAAGVSTLLRR
ncbi:MAG TPA: phosphatase PAP2 family protein [Conexibacter sp.]|jgi:membrane-associated phospholipid phosphatase